MTIVTATRISPRTRAAMSRPVAPAVILLHNARTLHFGPWCSHLKTDHRRDCRRHRVSHYRYMDTISRKLSWDNGSRSHEARLAMKRAMAHLMSDKRTADAKYVNADKVQSWSDDISGLRPGRNIEDAERDAIDHLFRSPGRASYDYDLWMSPLRNIQNYLASQKAPKDVLPEDVLSATTAQASHQKTPPHSKSKTSARHMSNRRRHSRKNVSQNAASSSSAFSPKYEDLDTHPASFDSAPSPLSDANAYGPALWNEPDGLPEKSAEELSKKYSDLDKYKPASWNEPDGLPSKTPEELSKDYSDLPQYTAAEWNEPDGLPEKTPEELSKNYDDLEKYTPVHWNEPDGLPDLTAEEKSKKYDDLDKYKPVEWNEPEGLKELTPEEKSKNYDDLDTYSDPFTAPEATIDAHAAAQLDATPKAQPLASKVEVSSSLPQYEDLHKYGPVQWNEPDGLRELTPEEKSKKYEDLHLYGAVQWNEPDGLPNPTPEEQSKLYKDLPAYEAESYPDADGVGARVHPEEASKAYEDLDLYRSTKIDAVDTPYPIHPEEASKAYGDLDAYQPVYHNELNESVGMDSPPAASGLDAFDKKADRYYASQLDSQSKHYSAQDWDAVESLTAEQVRARMPQSATEHARLRKLDEEATKYESAWDVDTMEAQRTVMESKQTSDRTLTGNYVRDFPEDFVESWSTPSNAASLLPKGMQADANGAATSSAGESKDDFELSSMDESFPMEEPRLEPALDRASASRQVSRVSTSADFSDPYSKIPQGLETSYEEECAGTSTWPTMVKHYRAEGSAGRSMTDGSPAEQPVSEGTYKVLAYDRTSQSVSVAEMTSGVLDQQAPLSPSEIMLKLSNPARFLPHFGPLHSQGYEVVSGSGDVLIFRKVRAASSDAAAEFPGQGPVNPIDLMGKPVMGNFASPTGFVSYESLADTDALKPEPPFRSNIDVRKEEPVFSGTRSEQQHTGSKKKKSLGRKIAVGGAWTVGIAYAATVLGEYFSTGGLDGLGPRGL